MKFAFILLILLFGCESNNSTEISEKREVDYGREVFTSRNLHNIRYNDVFISNIHYIAYKSFDGFVVISNITKDSLEIEVLKRKLQVE